MSEPIRLVFDVDGTDFSAAGNASMELKKELRSLGFPRDVVRRTSIAMYEGEINMVIHAGGGQAIIEISPEEISVTLADHGPGIPDVSRAMQEGYSTAPEEIREIGFGAGMGLPNMKKNSDEMRIESVVGTGTTVYMKFRVA